MIGKALKDHCPDHVRAQDKWTVQAESEMHRCYHRMIADFLDTLRVISGAIEHVRIGIRAAEATAVVTGKKSVNTMGGYPVSELRIPRNWCNIMHREGDTFLLRLCIQNDSPE